MSNGQADYDLSVFGPNAFLRVFKGSIASGKANIASSLTYDIQSNAVILGIHNRTKTASKEESSTITLTKRSNSRWNQMEN
jgi:hypothetical protein